jgi:cytidylate kinase
VTKRIIIAIDGYSSCGKSTLAKALAAELNYIYIDSGAMYRAVALYLMRHQMGYMEGITSAEQIESVLPSILIEFKRTNSGVCTFLNGENVEYDIRQMAVANKVSRVSTISAVRRFLVNQQQELGKNRGIVMDGRDIGTVVFPDAELKLFMTADPLIRAKRRQLELKDKGQDFSFDEIMKNLSERDHIDSTRADSPLLKADDAIVIDNSNLSPNQQLKIAIDLAMEKIAPL